MGLFEHWPYTNFHDLNLNWIISKIKNIETAEQSTAASEQAAAVSANAAAASAESAQASAENAALSEENAGQSAESAQNYAEHIADPVGGLVTGWLDDNITPTTPPVDASLTIQGAAADAKAAGDAINDLSNRIALLEAIPREVKLAMDTLFANMAVENDDVYTDEYAVFHAWATAINIVSISAVFTQGANIVYDTDTLDSLRQYLVVTATFDDESTAPITTYTLSGTLEPGTSTITVSYDGESTTFNVAVTERIDLTPSTYVVGTYGATSEGFTYDGTNVKRLVENPIGITGLKNGATYKASMNGETSVGYGIGMYTFAIVNPADLNRTVVEGTSKTISTDAMTYTSLGHTAWSSDDCTFTWTGGDKSILLINFRNSTNTNITNANKTAVRNSFTLTKVTGV